MKDYENLFSIFVHSDMQYKIQRCREHTHEGEDLSDKALQRKMKQIDKARAKHHDMVSHYDWGDRRGYHLIIDTTDWDIKLLAPIVAEFANKWFDKVNV